MLQLCSALAPAKLSHCTTNFTQEIYWEGRIQETGCLGGETAANRSGYRPQIASWGVGNRAFLGGLGLVNFCGLTLGLVQGLVQFQVLILGSSQGEDVFLWPISPYTLSKLLEPKKTSLFYVLLF